MSVGWQIVLFLAAFGLLIVLAFFLNYKLKKWVRRQGYEEALSMKRDELDLADRKFRILNQRSFKEY